MTNKSSNFSRRKSARKLTSYKSARSTISATSSSLYSGIASAQRAIQNPGYGLVCVFVIEDIEVWLFRPECSTRSKFSNELSVIFGPEELSSSQVQYHPWETKYNQIFIRENIKKAMTKEPYTETKYLINHANEKTTTKEECYPTLLSVKAIRVEKLIVHGEDKSAGKFNRLIHYFYFEFIHIAVPNSARQVRISSITPSERLLPPILKKKPSVTQLQVETKRSLPMIVTNKNIKQKPNSAAADPITGRVKFRNDASIIQRSTTRLSMEPVHETMTPLAVYA